MATQRQTYWQGILDTQAASGLTKAEFKLIFKIGGMTYLYLVSL